METTQQTQVTRTKFAIPAVNHVQFLAKIAKLSKTAAKLSLPAIEVTLLGTRKVEIKDDWNRPTGVYRKLYDYSVVGCAPKLAGWTFKAVIEPTEVGNKVRCVPGHDVDAAYQTATLSCQHCNKIRKRSEYFVVRNDDGSEKTVGRSCIKDFLGHKNPAALAAFMECISELKAGEDETSWGGTGGKLACVYGADDLAQWTIAVIGRYGFVPKSSMRVDTTSSEVEYILNYPSWGSAEAKIAWKENRERFEAFRNPEKAAEALAWIMDLENKTVRSNFENNLLIAVKLNELTYQDLGLFCAGIHVAMKAVGAAIAAREVLETKSNEWVGEIKKRQDFVLTVTKLRDIHTEYGTSVLFIMEDAKGNQLKWFASKDVGMEVGNTYEIKGTVKAHDTYQGRKQTSLSRCKVGKEVTTAEEKSA